MEILIAGLLLFLGLHLVPALPPLRAAAAGSLGENRYKGLFSLASAVGLVLIAWGYASADRGPQLFAPSAAARQLAPAAMALSFVLLAAANMRTHIRRVLRHPMLLGVGLWAATHLLATGHAKATVLFGAFLAYAAVDLGSAVARGATPVARGATPVARGATPTARGATRPFDAKAMHDAIAVGAGIVLALLVMGMHRWLFGLKVVPWGA